MLEYLDIYKLFKSGPVDELAVGLLLVCAAVGVALYKTKRLSAFQKVSLELIAIAVAFAVLAFRINTELTTNISIAALCVSPMVPLAIWSRKCSEYKKVISQLNTYNDEYDVVAAYHALSNMSERFLTQNQINVRKRDIAFCLHHLGKLKQSELILNQLQGNEAFKHFLLSATRFEYEGVAVSAEETEIAISAIDGHTEAWIVAQLYLNRGVMHTMTGEYQTADIEFQDAVVRCRELGVTSKSIINCLYENYAMNKTRLGYPDSGRAEAFKVLDEYAATLNLDKPKDAEYLFNMRMMLLRQLKAGQDELDAEFQSFLRSDVIAAKLQGKDKSMLMARMLNLAWQIGANPDIPIQYFNEDINRLRGLDEPLCRFVAHKSIAPLTVFLKPGDEEEDILAVISAELERYFAEDAYSDLIAYQKTLPPEAIKLQASCLEDLACLVARPNDAMSREDYLKEELALYLENGCNMDAVRVRWDLAKLEMEKDPDSAAAHLKEVESHVNKMAVHPALIMPFTEMCFAYGNLNMGADCMRIYKQLASMDKLTSVDLYAPGIRNEFAVASFLVRSFAFVDALQQFIENKQFMGLSPYPLSWAESLPRQDGYVEALLLAKSLGFTAGVPLSRWCWYDKEAGCDLYHAWLVFGEAKLQLDPTLWVLDDEDKKGRMAFPFQGHPFELDQSDSNAPAFVRTHLMCSQGQVKNVNFAAEDPQILQTIAEVLPRIEALMPAWVPSTQDVYEMYWKYMHAQPVPGAIQ